jgi:phosphopantetheinyl transferase
MEWRARPLDVAVHTAPDDPPSDFKRVHLWIGDLDEIFVGERVRLLSLDERERARRLADPEERHRFLAACLFVRQVLGGVTGVAPESLRFVEGDLGRPELAPVRISPERARRIRFGLSRSQRALALGLAVGHDVGVGLEVVRPTEDLLRWAESQLSASEAARLKSLPEREFLVEFCRLWTRREAMAGLDGALLLRAAGTPPRSARTTSFEFAMRDNLVVGSMAVSR